MEGLEGFNDPGKRLAFLNYTKDKLWAAIPGSVKQFPWEKAESVALRKLLVIGKETLKWSLFAFFGFSCVFDIPYSISRNKELVIPFGLFVGTLLAKYLDQISQELLHDHKDEHVTRRFLGISVFFVIVKFVSTFFPGGNSDFLLHVGNGGLMQVVWNWKNLPEQDGESSTSEDIPAN
ncbi:Unknown protein [Striga hermonthica]|uniref:Uncharacterized protein n=1 Tax=Striga hermonthica TaxID=68872 RepID=A0A9N7MKS2_STRHE|nr:Unknown protein [Striga hermonthica]